MFDSFLKPFSKTNLIDNAILTVVFPKLYYTKELEKLIYNHDKQ